MGNTNQSIPERSFVDLGKPKTDEEFVETMPKTFMERCNAMMLFGLFWTIVSWVIIAINLTIQITDKVQGLNDAQVASQSFILIFLGILAIIPGLTGLVGFIGAAVTHKKRLRAEQAAWRSAGKYRADLAPSETPMVDLSKMDRVPARKAREVAIYYGNNR